MIWPICLFVSLLVCSSEQLFIGSSFEQIQPSIKKLEKDFNTSQPDIVEGGPIFKRILDSGRWAQANEKKILLAQLISIYLNMFKNMTMTRTAKHIGDIIGALDNYKTKYSESLEKAEDIKYLAKLPMNDVKNQRKAVFELYHVLREVHRDENQERRKRSRRQNPQIQKRWKTNLSG